MDKREGVGKAVFVLGGLVVSLSANPLPAYALQTHGAPEGLFVHQGAHLFLIVSLLIFLANIRRSRLEVEKAWQLLFRGAFLLVLWNIWAFFGHVAEVFTPESVFVLLPGRVIPSLSVNSWREAAFYVLKMDNLLALPALLFFYGGLRKLQAALQKDGIYKKKGQSWLSGL